MSDLDNQHQDLPGHRYHYDFDTLLRQFMMRVFKPFIGPGITAELGSYEGQSTEIILEVIGEQPIDIIEGSSELADRVMRRFQDKPNVRVINRLFSDHSVEFNGDRYRNIILSNTLEHLEYPVKELQHISTWLTDDGFLFISVPNAGALSRRIATKMGLFRDITDVSESERLHGHYRTYDLKTLIKHVEAAGLEVIESGGFFVKPLSNGQFDTVRAYNIVNNEYLEACFELSKEFPELCSNIYTICRKTWWTR